jgi:hypothetical protein
MGIDNDIISALTSWDTTIIAKPTLHKSEQNPRPAPRNLYINEDGKGDIAQRSNDNSLDEEYYPFAITIFEASEDDAIKSIRATKKALHNTSVTNGYYRVKNFHVVEKNQLVTATLNCFKLKLVGDDEF